MDFHLWPRKLQVKATFMIIGIVASSLFFADLVERSYVTGLAKENIQLKTVALLKQVNAQIQTSAQLNNETTRKKILLELMERTPDLLFVSLYQVTSSGTTGPSLLTQMGEAGPMTRDVPSEVVLAIQQGKAVSTPQDSFADHIIKVALPIMIRKEIRGVAYAEFWTGQFDALTKFFQQWSQAIRIGLGLILILGINGFLFLWVLRPLAKIDEGIASLKLQNWKAQVPVASKDELGAIGRSFNAMVDKIRKVMEENQNLTYALGQSRDDLQHRIDQATAELMTKNEELTLLNEQLSAAQREVVQHQRLAVLGQLVATIAHKIGTPLTAISGHLQLLQETPDLLPEVKGRVDIVLQQTDRLGKVIQSLLNVARTPILHKELVPIHVFMQQIESFFRPICDERGITIVTECDPSVTTVQADSSQLQEVLGNLIDNAIDVMPSGGQLCLRVYSNQSAETLQEKSVVCIEVTDTGPGISLEQQPKIFDPFFTTKELGKGTGLGLAIAKEVVNLHGGSLTFRSDESHGASFLITLPA